MTAMRGGTVGGFWRAASRIAMVAATGSLGAACSSDAMRFSENPFSNPFATAANAAEPSMTGSIAKTSRAAAAPLTPAPVRTASLPAPGRTVPAAAPRVAASTAGWSSEGGTALTVKSGDTVSTISDRYGVPASAILSSNGLTAGQVTEGRRIIIPVFSTNPTRAAPSRPVAAAAAPAPVRSAPPQTIAQAAAIPVRPAPTPAKATVAVAKPKVEPAKVAAAKAEPVRVAKAAEPKKVPFVDPKTTGSVEGVNPARATPAAGKVAVAKAVENKAVAAPARAKVDPAKVAATAAPVTAKQAAARPKVEPPKVAVPAKVEAAKVEPAKPVEVAAPAPAPAAAEFRWPARGRVIAGFGGSGSNEGLNIAVPEGTPVKAAEAGTVAYAGSEVKGYGNLVLIKHDNGYVSAYAHNGDVDVKRGQRVTRGQIIAKSGQTGNVTSPQLHFEIRKGSTPVDPMRYLASN